MVQMSPPLEKAWQLARLEGIHAAEEEERGEEEMEHPLGMTVSSEAQQQMRVIPQLFHYRRWLKLSKV